MVLWGGLAFALTIGASPAQLLNEIIRGALTEVPSNVFGCDGVTECDLGYRMYSTAVSPVEINGPANPVDGIPRYNRKENRYQADAQTTANYPGSSAALDGNAWYIAWDGQTGGGTADHAGWYGLQGQTVNFGEIGNSFSFNCLPVIAQEACFAALNGDSGHGTVRADGTPIDPIGGISPISCPSLAGNSLSTLTFDWALLSNFSSRDDLEVGVTTNVYLLPNPIAAPTDLDLDAGAVLVSSVNNQAGFDSVTLDKADLAASAGLEGSTTYAAAITLTYPGGLESNFSCNSALTGTALLANEVGDAPCVVDTAQVYLETTDDGFVVITLDQCTNQVSQNQVHYELFFDAGDVEGNSSLDNTNGRVQFVIDAAGLQAAVGTTFGLSGSVKRPGGNRDRWDAGVLVY